MSELKLCPFCCGEVDNHKDDCYFRLYSVAFVDSLMLGKSGMNVHVSSRELFDAWNTRAERTCEPIYPNDSDFRENHVARCSECRRPLVEYESGEMANFCHFCGARVVES